MTKTHTKKIYDFAYSLAREYAKKEKYGYTMDWKDVSDQDKYEFACLLISKNKFDLDFIYNSDNAEELKTSILNAIKDDCSENEESLIQILRKNLVAYCDERMQEITEEALNGVEQEDNFENLRVIRFDRESGEHNWVNI